MSENLIQELKDSLMISGYTEEMAKAIANQMFGDLMKEGNK